MNPEAFREYCLSKPGVSESFPFNETTLVFKVGAKDKHKMFALIDLGKAEFVNLKCDPERSVELRDAYPTDIYPGYHMSKKHWNSVTINGAVPLELFQELVGHSYEIVKASLPKKIRELIK